MVLYFPGSVTTHDSVWTTLWFWGGSLNFLVQECCLLLIQLRALFKTRWHLLLGRVPLFFSNGPQSSFLLLLHHLGFRDISHLPKKAPSQDCHLWAVPPFMFPLMVSWSNRLSTFVSVDSLRAWHLPSRNDFYLCSATARPAAFLSFSSIL